MGVSSWTSKTLVALCFLTSGSAFTPASHFGNLQARNQVSRTRTQSQNGDACNDYSSARSYLHEDLPLLPLFTRRHAVSRAVAAVGFATTTSLVSLPWSRVGKAEAMEPDKFYPQMASYGAKDTKPCPDGFKPVLEFYGQKISGMDPLLVTYNSPNGWINVKPNIDNNGEDGTVSSGDYGKGDSASLYVGPPLKQGSSLESREAVEAAVYGGLTVKGEAQVQGFKLTKVAKLDFPTKQPYYLVEYKYTLLTGAGFEINRKGVGSVTAAGDKNVQAMLGASTDIRFKKTEANLREIAESFRVYDGVKPPMLASLV